MTGELENLISFLSTYIKFEEEEIQTINELIIRKKYHKKETFFREGDTHQHLAFIKKGAVRFYYIDEAGKEKTFEFAIENCAIGKYKGVVAKTVSQVYVEAIEDTVLIGIHRDNFLKLLEQNPKYYQVICELNSEGLKQVENRNKLLHIASSRKRYEEFMQLRPEIINRVPLKYIASYLNMALGIAWAQCEDNFNMMQDNFSLIKGLGGKVMGKKAAAVDFISEIFGFKEFTEQNYNRDIDAEMEELLLAYTAALNRYAELNLSEIKKIKNCFQLMKKRCWLYTYYNFN